MLSLSRGYGVVFFFFFKKKKRLRIDNLIFKLLWESADLLVIYKKHSEVRI